MKNKHSPLFHPSEEVIGKEHAHKQQEYDHSRPHGKESKRSDAQTKVLGMADIAVAPGRHHFSAEQTRAVDLDSEKEEAHEAQAESVTAQVPTQKLQKRTRRKHRVRKHKSGQPRSGSRVVKPLQRGPIGGVEEVEGERTDHDDDFEHDETVKDGNRTREPPTRRTPWRRGQDTLGRWSGQHRSSSSTCDCIRNVPHIFSMPPAVSNHAPYNFVRTVISTGI